jgi:uncharacterized membrane protein
MLRHALLLLHLLSAIGWLGGMFFAYFCLRPAAAQVLAPPQRLPLWAATFARFLPLMAVAVLVLLATGFTMLAQSGAQGAPHGWFVMMGLGVVMALVFAWVLLGPFPTLRAHCTAQDWPAAGAALNRIRQAVAVNLALGLLVVAAAVSAR